MNKNHLLFFLMLLFAFNVGVAQEAPDLEDAKRLLQTWLEAQKDYEQLPGIAVAVVNDQDLIWKEGFGFADVEAKTSYPNQHHLQHLLNFQALYRYFHHATERCR
jgi:CubicO group peptidase (beta-lactamase class C family)